jgi:hypothetical protein
MILLTLMVLTSDDVSFSTGLSDTISSEDEGPLRAGYGPALAKLRREPSLMLSFAPLLMNVGGDFYVETFSRLSGGVPNFGMVSVDHNSDYRESKVILNGAAYYDRYALVLLAGAVKAEFFTGSISTDKIFREKGLVTASSGNQLQTVDGKPAADYLREVGFASDENGMIVGINTFPFIVDYNDGTTPVMRAIFAQTPEGWAVCGGDVPVGATLSIGNMDAREVIATTAATLSTVLAARGARCVLMFSCVGRYFKLGYDQTKEIEKVQEILEGTGIPYQLAYSGGEICPVYDRERHGESRTNRYHNITFVACVL